MKTSILLIISFLFIVFPDTRSYGQMFDPDSERWNADTIKIEPVYISRDYHLLAISSTASNRLYIQSPVVFTDAVMNIVDEQGDEWMEHTFAVISELDISVKNLPSGNYRVIIKGEQGMSHSSFSR